MTSHGKLRKERVGLVDYDTQIKGKIIVVYYFSSGRHVIFVGKQKQKQNNSHFWQHFQNELYSAMRAFFPLHVWSTFRGSLSAWRPAEGAGLDAGAEEPAAAGHERLPQATGGDWKRVRPLSGKTGWKVHLEDQKVKEVLRAQLTRSSSVFLWSTHAHPWLCCLSASHMHRKEPSGNSVAQVWLALLSHTRQESKDHNGLSESCSNFLIQPLAHCLEYTQRLAKKVLTGAPAPTEPFIIHLGQVCTCRN